MEERKKKYIIANWKMNKNIYTGVNYILSFMLDYKEGNLESENEVIFAPSFTMLDAINSKIKGKKLKLAAQNMFFAKEGAFTGEISPTMLKDFNKLEYVILGHSERRDYFIESFELINKKVKAALKYGLKPIICVGETEEEKNAEVTHQILVRQLTEALEGVKITDLNKIIFAYEPIWAIGTGKTMTPKEANEIADFFDRFIGRLYETPLTVTTVYGGSVNAANSKELFSQPKLDGVLVGGASLDVKKFLKIVEDANE